MDAKSALTNTQQTQKLIAFNLRENHICFQVYTSFDMLAST